MPLFNLPGVSLPHKKGTAKIAPVAMPTPASVLVPLSMHIGAPATPVVKTGDLVTVGQVIAESIHEFFASEDNKVVVERLKAAGLKFEMEAESKALSSALEGMTIVISGNFSISRDDMKALIAAHGGKNSGSVSGRTSYLLAGEKAGPEKLRKAEALGVKIIDENGFRTLIEN